MVFRPNYFVAASLSFIKGSGYFFGTFLLFRTMLIKTLGVAFHFFVLCVFAYKMKSLRIYRSRARLCCSEGLLSTRNTFAALFTLAAASALSPTSHSSSMLESVNCYFFFLLPSFVLRFLTFLLFRVITRYFFSLCLHISHALSALGRRILKLFTLDTCREQGWTQKFTLGWCFDVEQTFSFLGGLRVKLSAHAHAAGLDPGYLRDYKLKFFHNFHLSKKKETQKLWHLTNFLCFFRRAKFTRAGHNESAISLCCKFIICSYNLLFSLRQTRTFSNVCF